MDSEKEQLRMDLEEAHLRLERIGDAVAEVERCKEEVKTAQVRLIGAKKRLKEAEWKLNGICPRKKKK